VLRNLLPFEIALHTRQVGFWVTILVMIAFGLLTSTEFVNLSLEGGSRVKTNGAIPLALNIGFLSLLSIFFSAVFVVTGVMRDDTHKSLEIIHATPVGTPAMIGARMIGVWVATVLCILAGVLGMVAGQFMPWADAETFQTLNALHVIQPILLFVLINALLVAGIYTLVASVTRNRALVYVSAVAILAAYLGSGIIAGENPPDAVAALIDPFGLGALGVETRYWPPAEQNAVVAPVAGWLGWNRLLWGAVALVAFGAAFTLSTRGIVKRRSKRRVEDESFELPTRVASVTPQLGASHVLAAFWTRVKFEYLATVRTTAFAILVGIALVLFGISLFAQSMFDANPTLPTTNFITQIALGSLTIPMIIIMVFFGSDIMWRDRVANLHGILDATPVKSVSLLFAKWGALALVLLTLIVASLVVAGVTQLFLGGGVVPIVPGTMIAIGLFSFFTIFFFQGMLVMFLQNFMPGRVIGMLVAAGVLMGLVFALGNMPFFHPLMDFGSPSAGQYSELAGFQNLGAWLWETAYWLTLIVMLGVLSIWVWRRGLQVGLSSRLRKIPKRLTIPSMVTGALASAAFGSLAVMGARSYSEQDYRNTDTLEAAQADLERLVADVYDRPLPKVRSVTVDVDFFPSTRTAEFSGRYRFENPHDEPIERLFVYAQVGIDNADITIEGAERVTGETIADTLAADYEVMEFEFTPPLAPGESRNLAFTTRFDPPTITDGSAIARNGTFVDANAAMPVFGGLDNFFLSSNDTRRKFDLGEAKDLPVRDAPGTSDNSLFSPYADYVDFDARVCTDSGQIPIAPGRLMSTYQDDGRDCREYEAENPIQFFFSFLSADYEHRTDVWKDVDGTNNGRDVELEIYFHPEHDFNVDLMFAAMKQSFTTYTETYGPYQYRQLRIMEFPYASFAQAFAGTVPFSENIGFVQDPGKADDPESVDFASYVTMHEIGHQWFAHQLIGAYAEGSNVLSEGLTENATMLAYEDLFGFDRARRMHEERAVRQYLFQRTAQREDEYPLARARMGDQFLVYNKASWVFWGLRNTLGDDVVQGAIRDYLREESTQRPPYTTTLSLVDRLEAAAGPEYATLVRDYWDRITFWELKLGEDITVTPKGNMFDVSVPVTLDKKYAAEEDGAETSVLEDEQDGELNEWFEVGFYTENPADDLGVNPSHIEGVRVTENVSVLTFTVAERPTHIVLDPKRLLIERNVTDNVRAVPESAS